MIDLGLRLVRKSGRDSLRRFAVTAVGVAMGVVLLLLTLGSIHAVSRQNERVAWVYSTEHNVAPSVDERTTQPLLWQLSGDTYDDQLIGRIDVAATGPRSPVPSGISRLPRPGELFASPELAELMRAHPASQLADRFPGHLVGTVDPAVLPAPSSLLVIVGRAPAALAGKDQVLSLRSFETSAAVSGRGFDGGIAGYNSGRAGLVGYAVTLGLLVPILMFIAATTRLDATRREERFAAMRLVGATPGQVAALSAVESASAGVVGAGLGAAAFYALRPWLVRLPFLGGTFHTEDVSVSAVELAIALLVVPLTAVLVSAVALRRVRVSPLGVVRRARPKPPRAYRLLPLVAGIAELVLVLVVGVPHSSTGQERVFAPGFLLVLVGIGLAGPWFTMILAKLMARHSNSATSLLAVRRLSDNPHSAFRAVSGVVLAVFTSSVAFGVITTIVVSHTGQLNRDGVGSTLFLTGPGELTDLAAPPLTRLRAIPGVTGIAVAHRDPQLSPVPLASNGPGQPLRLDPTAPSVISCAELAAVPAVGRCANPSFAARFDFDPGGSIIGKQGQLDSRWPAAPVTAEQLARLPVSQVLVATNGHAAAIEQARTTLELAYPTLQAERVGSWSPSIVEQQRQYQQLAYAIIVGGLVVAGCTLGVAAVGGIVERRRPFSLLRLTGVSLADLRRVVMLESTLPLVAAVAASVVLGLVSAQLFLRAQVKVSLTAPSPGYYASLAAGVLVSLAVIGATLPLLARATGPETARNQ